MFFVWVELKGRNQVAQIGEVWLDSGTVGKGGGMKETEWALSQTIPHHVACLLRNKIFFFLLLLLSIINYFFFFRLKNFVLLTFSRSGRQPSGTLRSMYTAFLEGILCYTQQSHRYCSYTCNKQARGSRSVALPSFSKIPRAPIERKIVYNVHSLSWQRQRQIWINW